MAWTWREIVVTFQGCRYAVSTRALLLLSMLIGLVGGAYGIGGGAIMAPFLVSLFGLPIFIVAGATLAATTATSLAGVGFYTLLAPYCAGVAVSPDWQLGCIVGLGGMCGMYLGARCQKHVPSTVLKCLLAGVLLCTAMRYLYSAL